MAEYIERGTAIKVAELAHKRLGNPYENIREVFAAIPAADVRPVVLCRDCEYWNRERISCEGLAQCNTGESGIRYRSQYDFCSRGEKREES